MQVTEEKLHEIVSGRKHLEFLSREELQVICDEIGITVDPNYVHQEKIMRKRILELANFKLSLIMQRRGF